MSVSNSVELVVLLVAFGGLIAVVAEILIKDPRILGEIVTDVQAFARAAPPPLIRPGRSAADHAAGAPAVLPNTTLPNVG